MFEALLYFPMTEDERADGTSIPGTGACKLLKNYDSIHKVLDWMKGWDSHNFRSCDSKARDGVYTFRLSGLQFLQLSTEYYQGEYSSHRGTKLEELSNHIYDLWNDSGFKPTIESLDDWLLDITRKHMIEKYAKFVGKPHQLGEELGYGSRVLIKSMGVDFALIHMIPDGKGQIDFHFQKLDTCQHEWEAQLDWDRTNEMTFDPNRKKVPTGKYFCRICGEERVRTHTPF